MKKRTGDRQGILQSAWITSNPKARMGNATLFCNCPRIVLIAIVAISSLLFIKYTLFNRSDLKPKKSGIVQVYNSTYPLSPSFKSPNGDISYHIGIIADLDTNSKTGSNAWRSYFKRGQLRKEGSGYKIHFDEDLIQIQSKLSYGGRGMELSELTAFNGALYSCDDRTGVVYKLLFDSGSIRPLPWVILPDGSGNEEKGFKCEWMTVKDEHLIIGGLGKEWTTSDGVVLSHNPMYIKRISMNGAVEHINWVDEYVAVRKAAGITAPGYMIHEAIEWSPVHEKWFFLPRRASTEKYNDVTDEEKGTNFLLKMSHDNAVEVLRVGGSKKIEFPSHGFSSFKFIPGTMDRHILALKSQELKGVIASYIMIMDSNGNILLPETKIGDFKFEGVEFI